MSPSIPQILSLLLPLFALFQQAISQIPSVSLPALLGPHTVGTTRLSLTDPHTSRKLSISLFYPTKLPSYNPYHLAPDFTPLYAAYLEELNGIPPGLASTVLSQAWEGAPIYLPCKRDNNKHKATKILVFTPGYGDSHEDYTAIATNLASYAYLVIAVSHPNDTVFIEYPDGTSVITPSIELDAVSAAQKVDVRVKDLQFLINVLRNGRLNKHIPGAGDPKLKSEIQELLSSKVGVLGHSLGGATAASAMFADTRFKCGANMDGSIWGDVVNPKVKGGPGVKGEFFIMGAETRNRTSDLTWGAFWEAGKRKGQRGGVEVSVKGATHGSYSDLAVLYGYLRKLNLIPELPVEEFGTIDGERILQIESAYFSAFFDRCLKGEGSRLLDGPSKKFPEVKFWGK